MAGAQGWESAAWEEQARALAIHAKTDLPPTMIKYWNARHSLFSRFSEGILLDEESWFSVTPEAVAYRIAVQCASGLVLDAFCGAGGNAIQFAMTCEHVVAIDIDPVKLTMAKHNAAIYGVQDRITFLCGNFCEFARAHAQRCEATAAEDPWHGWQHRTFDVVFLSPPWGGVDYLRPDTLSDDHSKATPSAYADVYPLEALRPVGGQALFAHARAISDKVVFYIPRNVDLDDVAQLAHTSAQAPIAVHVEELWMGYKLKALAVYLDTARDAGLVSEMQAGNPAGGPGRAKDGA